MNAISIKDTKGADTAQPRIGVRSTRQRSALLELLSSTEEFRTAQDLHADLRKSNEKVGLTTVYRTLQSLAEAGVIDTTRTDSGESLYRLCSNEHHHHLLCRECGTTVEISAELVERWSADIAAKYHFSDVNHTLELVGRCRDCTRAAAATR